MLPGFPPFFRSDMSYRGDFVDIMEVIDKRLNDKGKNWRHVFKVSGHPYHKQSFAASR